MSASSTIRRWSSSTQGSPEGIEIGSGASVAADLEQLLSRVSRPVRMAASFVILHLATADQPELDDAIGAVRAGTKNPRICLAVSSARLRELDVSLLSSRNVGVMLDAVDLGTPLSDLLFDSITAVRFTDDFVFRATRDIRVGCALDAILELAKSIGFATLGPVTAPSIEWLAPGPKFDFVRLHLAHPKGQAASSRQTNATRNVHAPDQQSRSRA